MNFHKLQNQFWQLYAVERFSGNVTLLYFYWLNRFNTGLNGVFWPAEYPRWSKQVEADLGITDKPLAAARKVLEQRGLLYYREGSKSKAPIWSLRPIVRKNSGQYENISRNNSDESEPIAPCIDRNNSGQSDRLPPALAGESPDSIRRRHKPVLEQEDTNQKNIVAGADFYKEHASLSLTSSKIVIALTPLLPAPREEVPTPDNPEEAYAFVPEIAALWHVSQQHNKRSWAKLTRFALKQAELGNMGYLREQFAGFKSYFGNAGLTPHNQDKYTGHEGQTPSYSGTWCECDWVAKAKERTPKPLNRVPPVPTRASASLSSTPNTFR